MSDVIENPYIFICHSHADREAQEEIRRLEADGVAVWYDRHLKPGREWSDELAARIEGCDQFIYLITPNSVASEHCRDELNFAREEGKSIIGIQLVPTELPRGLRLSLNNRQMLLKYDLSESEYKAKLGNILTGTRTVEQGLARAPRRRGTRNVAMASIVIVAALTAVTLWQWFGGQRLQENPEGAHTAKPATVNQVERQLTFSGEAFGPRISPDGQVVAFYGPQGRITTHDVLSDDQFVLDQSSDLAGDRCLLHHWSPDSRELLVACGLGGAGGTAFTISRQAKIVRRVSFPGFRTGVWSADGEYLLFSGDNLWFRSLDVESQVSRRLARPEIWADQWLIAMRAVHDHVFLVLTRDQGSGMSSVWTLDLQGDLPDVQFLMSPDFNVHDVEVVSASRAYLIGRESGLLVVKRFDPLARSATVDALSENYGAISISRSGRASFVRGLGTSSLFSATEGVPKQITKGTWGDGRPILSPDGSTIAVVRHFGGVSNLFSVPFDGGPATRLTHFEEGMIGPPAWSPDGQTLAFRTDLAGEHQLWTMRADGSGLRIVPELELSTGFFVGWTPFSELVYQIPGNTTHRVVDPRTGDDRPLLSLTDLFDFDMSPNGDNPSTGWSFGPRYSPDGTKIAFSSWNRVGGGIWVIDVSDGAPRAWQIAGTPPSGIVYQLLDALPLRGKTVRVRLEARTEEPQEVRRPGGMVQLLALREPFAGGAVLEEHVTSRARHVTDGRWRQLEVELTVPSDAVELGILCRTETGPTWFRNIVLEAENGGGWQNLALTNSTFRQGLEGWELSRPEGFHEIGVDSEGGQRALKIVALPSARPEPQRWFLQGWSSNDSLLLTFDRALWRYSLNDGSMTELRRNTSDDVISAYSVSADGEQSAFVLRESQNDVWLLEGFDSSR